MEQSLRGGNRETKARAREGEIFQYSQWNLLKRVGDNRGDTPLMVRAEQKSTGKRTREHWF